MSENALARLARLVGGVAMMQGGLGPQVLGQMLIAGTSELAVAGAAVIVAGTTRVKHPGAQFAIRTAAPAIALQSIFARREALLHRRERELLQRERTLGSAARLADRNQSLAAANAALHHDLEALHLVCVERQIDQTFLRTYNQELRDGALRGEKDRLREERDRLTEERDRLREAQRQLQARLDEMALASASTAAPTLEPAPELAPELAAKKKRARRRADTKRTTRKPRR